MNEAVSEDSLIIKVIVGLLYPFIMLLGFFVIINGHYTPGGGFQGGSVLATLFVARYLIYPVADTDTEALHTIQRIFLALIILVPGALLFSGRLAAAPAFNTYYLTLMDILIGVQVGLGLGIAVLRFAFFEGVGKTWKL
ncbi:MAG: MnhB domain-containing protein [Alkalispirochaetaceae bacterium]